MPRLYVVLDTNAYVGLRNDELAAMIHRERACGIVPAASYPVAAELIAHLDSPESDSFGRSWAALRRLVHHCTYFNGDYCLRWMADAERLICRQVFGVGIPEREGFDPNRMGQFVGSLAAVDSRAGLLPYAEEIARTRAYIHALEENLTQGLWSGFVCQHVPGAKNWGAIAADKALRRELVARLDEPNTLRQLALPFVFQAAAVGIVLPAGPEEFVVAIDRFLSIFTLQMRFVRETLRSVIEDGRDMSKPTNANDAIDMLVSFATAKRARIDGVPVWLITGEGRIRRVARAAGMAGLVRQKDEYLTLLNAGSEAIEEAVAASTK